MPAKRRYKRRGRKKGRPPSGPVSYELDRFTLHDLRSWNKANKSIAEYHIRVYYELEAQRQLNRKQLNAALRDARLDSFEIDHWVRMVDYKYSLQPLSAAGSIRSIGGRYNIGSGLNPKLNSFHGLYIAEDAETAFREYFGEPRGALGVLDLALMPKKSFASVFVSGTLHNVLDVTSAKRLRSFCSAFRHFTINPSYKNLLAGTNIKPLSIAIDPSILLRTLEAQNWRELGMQLGIPSNSQVFGRLAFEAGYDGIVFQSARNGKRCACVFLENLTHSETNLSLADPAPSDDTIATLDGTTWPKLIAPPDQRDRKSRAIKKQANLH